MKDARNALSGTLIVLESSHDPKSYRTLQSRLTNHLLLHFLAPFFHDWLQSSHGCSVAAIAGIQTDQLQTSDLMRQRASLKAPHQSFLPTPLQGHARKTLQSKEGVSEVQGTQNFDAFLPQTRLHVQLIQVLVLLGRGVSDLIGMPCLL